VDATPFPCQYEHWILHANGSSNQDGKHAPPLRNRFHAICIVFSWQWSQPSARRLEPHAGFLRLVHAAKDQR